MISGHAGLQWENGETGARGELFVPEHVPTRFFFFGVARAESPRHASTGTRLLFVSWAVLQV